MINILVEMVVRKCTSMERVIKVNPSLNINSTKLSLKQGFNMNLFSNEPNSPSGNSIRLIGNYQSYICDIVTDETNENQITFFIP